MSRRALKLALRRIFILYIDKTARDAETGGQRRAGKSDCEERKYNSDRRYRQTRYERVGMLLLVVDVVVVVVPDVVSVNGDVVVDVAVVHVVVVVVVVDVVPVAVIVVAVVVVVRLYIFCFYLADIFLWTKSTRFFILFFVSFFCSIFLRYSEFRLDSFNLSILVNRSCVPSLSQRRVQEGSNAIEQIHDCSVIFLGDKIGTFWTRSNEKSGI